MATMKGLPDVSGEDLCEMYETECAVEGEIGGVTVIQNDYFDMKMINIEIYCHRLSLFPCMTLVETFVRHAFS